MLAYALVLPVTSYAGPADSQQGSLHLTCVPPLSIPAVLALETAIDNHQQ